MKRAKKAAIPKVKPNIDFSNVIEACEDILKTMVDGTYHADNEEWIYEEVMEAIYGLDVWDWIILKLQVKNNVWS